MTKRKRTSKKRLNTKPTTYRKRKNTKRRRTTKKQKRATILMQFLLLFIGSVLLYQWKPTEINHMISESVEYIEGAVLTAEDITGPVEGELEVHFLDIGQGDATLLICDGEAMLIDAGDNSRGTAVQNYLEKQGVETLKYVIGTHPHEDHIGGLDVILYKFDCETVILPNVEYDTKTNDDVYETMENKNYQVELPVVGKSYTFGSSSFVILGPSEAGYGDNLNNYSVSILLTHGESTFIFTGDAEIEAEEDMLDTGISLQADVYQVGHHGSSSSSSEAFVEAIDPQWAVISCGEDNSYGHPHSEVLNRLRTNEIEVFRTDEQGVIVATSDGENITWNMSPSTTWQTGS
ncbi:MAG: ComEC/Rec2 family competence protein [Eubacteriales bacterium]